MYIYKIRGILDAIREFSAGSCSLLVLAQTLQMPYHRLETLLLSAGIIDGSATLSLDAQYQDVVNVIQLYFAMSKAVHFKTLQFHEKIGTPHVG